MVHPLILLPLLAGAVYPPHSDNHLNDFAGVIKPAEAERIRARAQGVLQAQGIPIVVATIQSLAEQDAAGWSIERYATNLYNEWGIGERAANRGVLLLVSVRDRKLRIATGSGLGNYDDRARRVIDGTIVPKLKSGDLSGGIAAGLDAIAGWFETARAGAPATAAPEDGLPPGRVPGGEGAGWSPHGTGVIRKTERGGGISSLFKVFLLVIGIALVFSILRRRRSDTGGYGGPYGGSHGGGWGGFLLGGLAGFLGSQLLRGSGKGSQWGSGGSSFGGGSGGSFGGGFSSGGGASGSW